MNSRFIPPLLATVALIVSYLIWWPFRPVSRVIPDIPQPILPTAAELPEFQDEPDKITLFDTSKRTLKHGPISITRSAATADNDAKQYRLRAYIGGNDLWVVTLEDNNGKYCTIRNGELIPHTHLEFRGVEFHTASNGLPEGTAVFFDQSKSNYVDVVACSSDEAMPDNNANSGSVQ